MPQKKIKYISKKSIDKLIINTKQILKKSISLGGSSIKDFKDGTGKKGNFQHKFKVYGREGSVCAKNKCKSLIKKTYIANRATYYCQSCQK
jgi:formamidopyrimidine-DNA glycosylase